jgi:ribosomal protein S18 acetylase RimI-like enzyme
MAKNKDGNIVGVVFCHIIDKNKPFVYHSKKEYLQQGWPCDFIPVLLLLDQLCHHQNILKSKNVDRFIDIFAVVVNTNYRRRGLASQLITKTLDEAQASNMPLATISCT